MQYLIKEDIYDDKGRLLIRKGEIIKESTAEKLKKHKIAFKSIVSSDSKTVEPIDKEKFVTKFNIKSRDIIDYPSTILESIIFSSKDKPWCLHVKLLSNYIDWLYVHSIDTSLISLIIGKQLNLTDAQLLNLGLGALLHDTGKLLIPKEIIENPMELDEKAMSVLKRHCELGAKSMKAYKINDECSDIILHHHEMLDGSGYPDGLKGNEISLNCKIVIIADTIDTLTSGRAYKNPNSMNYAIDFLRENSEKYPQNILNVFTDLII